MQRVFMWMRKRQKKITVRICSCGLITDTRQEEAAGKTQKVLGKAKDKVQDLKDSLTGNDKEGTQ